MKDSHMMYPEDVPIPERYPESDDDKDVPWAIDYDEWKQPEQYIPKYFY